MTNYIEQLMKAAGVEPEKRFKECKENAKDTGLCTKYPCIKCESSVFTDKYPVFTPEKQVELIKLIVDKCQEIKIYKNKCMDSFLFQAQENWGEYEHKANAENFGSCLAILILELLKNNKLDKSELKRILEDG